VALLIGTGGSVNALVPFYAIGVFTGFAMAGYGMTKHHITHREPGWRYKLVLNLSAGVVSTIVVAIFAVAKFTEGAWLVVVVFPLLVFVLIRLNREYRGEAAILEDFRTHRPEIVKYARHRVFAFVNSLDLAVLEALRYGRSLRADELTAVHFVVDLPHARLLQKRWEYYGVEIPLRLVDCPDRRLARTAQDLVCNALAEYRNTNVTVVLPRRSYAPLLGRLLHDRTADKVARAISEIPDAAATIVPYDVQARMRKRFPDPLEERLARKADQVLARITARDQQRLNSYEYPEVPPTVMAVDGLVAGRLGTIEGRVSEVDDTTTDNGTVRVVVVGDHSGELRVTFGPDRGTDIQPGQLLRITGKARQPGHRQVHMVDPIYRIIEPSTDAVSNRTPTPPGPGGNEIALPLQPR
jgi:hypothetical protein